MYRYSCRSQTSPMDAATVQQPQQPQQPLADPMMSSYDAFEPAFVSYTTVSHQNFPSPPGSPHPVVSSTTSNFETNPPQNYGHYYSPIHLQGDQGAGASSQDLPLFSAISMKTEHGKSKAEQI